MNESIINTYIEVLTADYVDVWKQKVMAHARYVALENSQSVLAKRAEELEAERQANIDRVSELEAQVKALTDEGYALLKRVEELAADRTRMGAEAGRYRTEIEIARREATKFETRATEAETRAVIAERALEQAKADASFAPAVEAPVEIAPEPPRRKRKTPVAE